MSNFTSSSIHQSILQNVCCACMRKRNVKMNQSKVADSKHIEFLSFYDYPQSSTCQSLRIVDIFKYTIPQILIDDTDESLPIFVCSICITHLLQLYEFQQTCLRSQQIILELNQEILSVQKNTPLVVADEANEVVSIPSNSELQDPLIGDIKEYSNEEKMKEVKKFITKNQNLVRTISIYVKDENKFEEKKEEAIRIIYEVGHTQAVLTSLNTLACKDNAKNTCNKTDEPIESEINSDSDDHRHAHKETVANEEEITKTLKYTCLQCGQFYETAHTLSNHKRIHRKNNQAVCKVVKKQEELKPYSCNYCHKAFQQSSALKEHIRTHTGEKPYLCAECGKAFKSSSNLKQHLLRHSGILRYECPECPKKFPCLSDLASHKAVHKPEKPHVCDICGASFGKQFQLKKHTMYHNGEKPHKCEYCEMRFVCGDHMRRHMRTHTGEKPYKCKYCERAFAQSNDMIKHLRCHLGENVYLCELCPRSFRLASELRCHFTEHKNDTDEVRTKNLKALREKQSKLRIKLAASGCDIPINEIKQRSLL